MKAIKNRSKKAKGSRLELKVAKRLRELDIDPKAARMPLSGASWALRSDIHTTFPYMIECKNQERMNFWEWWEQAKAEEKPMKPSILVHSANHRPIMVSMELETFLQLYKEMLDYKQAFEQNK